jgi:hypothetical protein
VQAERGTALTHLLRHPVIKWENMPGILALKTIFFFCHFEFYTRLIFSGRVGCISPAPTARLTTVFAAAHLCNRLTLYGEFSKASGSITTCV